MDEQENCEKLFGPYDTYPRVYISHSDLKPNLKRIIFQEEPEVIVQKPQNEDNNSMTWKQLILYYLFLYNPTKKQELKPQTRERRIPGEEVLCESVSFFEVVQKPDGYYVHARIRV